MTPAEEQELIADWKAGDLLAGAALVKAFEGFIRRLVGSFVTARCELDDLMQIGRIYLLQAATTHDANLGRLSTHAWCTIRGHVRNYAYKQRFAIEISAAERRAGSRPLAVSIDAKAHWHGSQTVGDTLAAPVPDEPSVDVDAAKLVARLRVRERAVVERLFVRGETLEQIGAAYGVSKQAIGITKKKALARLREAATSSQ